MNLFVHVFLMSLVFSQEKDKSPINLLLLAKHYKMHGMSVMYTGLLKLLTNKMQKQVSYTSSLAPLQGGNDWSVRLNFTFACKQTSDSAIAFWFTKNKLEILEKDYLFENFSHLFGFGSQVQGLGIVYRNHELNISLLDSDQVNRQAFDTISKTCKIYKNSKDQFEVTVKYIGKSIIAVYTKDRDLREETLCLQTPVKIDFSYFFLNMTGLDDNGNCSAEVKEAYFKTDAPIEFVPLKDKQEGDNFYAYQEKIEDKMYHKKWENYHQNFLYAMERSKILAKELLVFAEENVEQTDLRIKGKYNFLSEKISTAIKLIEKEAEQLQTFANIIADDKDKSYSDINEYFDKLLGYLTQVDNIYSKVDSYSMSVLNVAEKLDMASKIDSLSQNAEKIASRLETFISHTGKLKENPLKFLERKKIKVVKKWIKGNMSGKSKQK